MRIHVVKLGVLSALVAAVLAQAGSARELTAAVPASEKLPVPAATASIVRLAELGSRVAVPEQWSFDDGTGEAALTVATAVSTTPTARRPVSPRKPPKPPTRARSGAMPAAGSPQAVLAAAYVKAVSRAPKGCHLKVTHLAAIGQVESGSVGGRSIGGDHRVSPAIYGPLLDGGPFAVVHDSDGGAFDGAGDYDRAVGPLQFLPGTWRWAGRDGDGDGRRDPQNVFDAAMATADYLCRDGRDLSRASDLRGAILTYNWSGEYVAAVTQWVSFFTRHGLAALDDVAFRVGSGGRASAMAVAKEPAKDTEKNAAKHTAAAKAKAPTTPATQPAPGSPTRPGATSTPTPTGTPSTDSPSTPTPTSTIPEPDPTTPAPEPTTPEPTTPEPSTPAPESTTPPPSEPSGEASTPSTG